MGWGRIDDSLYAHRKWVFLSWASRGVWTTLVSWCCQQSNSGRFTLADVAYLTGEDLSLAISELRFKGLVDEVAETGGCKSYQLHDFLFWNPGANQVEEAKAAEERSRRARQAGKLSQAGRTTKMRGCPDCDRQPRACYEHSSKKRKRDEARNVRGTLSPTLVLRQSYSSPTPLVYTSPKSAFHKGEATSSPSHPTPPNRQSNDQPVVGPVPDQPLEQSPQSSLKQKILETVGIVWLEWPRNPQSFETRASATKAVTGALATTSDLERFQAAALNYAAVKAATTGDHAAKTLKIETFVKDYEKYVPDDFVAGQPWPPTSRPRQPVATEINPLDLTLS